MDTISETLENNNSPSCEDLLPTIDFEQIREGTRRAFFIAHDFRMEQKYSMEEIQTIMTNYMILEGMPTLQAHELMNQINEIQNSSGSVNLEFESGLVNKMQTDIAAFDTFVQTIEPTLEESKEFWNSKRSGLELNSLNCQRSQQLFELFTHSIEGYLEFYYAFYNPNDNSRDCEGFWDNLGCSVGAFFNINNILSNIIYVGVIVVGAAVIPLGGAIAPVGVTVIGIGVGGIIGVSSNEFNDCCENLNPPPGCWPADIIFPALLDCDSDEVEIRAVGSGYGITSWVWENQNTNPNNTVTNTARLTVTIPQPNSQFRIRVSSLCSDGNNEGSIEEIFSKSALSVDAYPVWSQEPPQYANRLSTHTASIENNPVHSQIKWSVSGMAQIMSTGPANKASIFYTGAGDAVVTVTVTDACSGEQLKINKTVIVSY